MLLTTARWEEGSGGERQTGSMAPSADPNVFQGLPLTQLGRSLTSMQLARLGRKSGAITPVRIEPLWNLVQEYLLFAATRCSVCSELDVNHDRVLIIFLL